MNICLRKIIYFFIISVLLLSLPSGLAASRTRLVFLSDSNLYPTPVSTIRTKSYYEKKNGLLVYESQAILQELIRYINQKLSPDYVIFGGNNILDVTDKQFSNFSNTNPHDLWHLFLDMISEIKSDYFFVFGSNETKLNDAGELIRSLNNINIPSTETWWYKKIEDKKIMFVGLDSSLFSFSPSLSAKQIKWLNAVLSNNKDFITIISMHDSLVDPEGKVLNNKYSSQVFKFVKENPQVKLVLSGGLHLNRIRKANSSFLVVSSSSISYPCTFKVVDISSSGLTIKTVKIPLKGVLKKSEKSLIDSEFSINALFPSSKAVLDYLLGSKSDNDLDVVF